MRRTKDPKPDANSVSLHEDQTLSGESGNVDKTSPETLSDETSTKTPQSVDTSDAESPESDTDIEKATKKAHTSDDESPGENSRSDQKREAQDENSTKSLNDVDEEPSQSNTNIKKPSNKRRLSSRIAEKALPSEISGKSAEVAWISQKLQEMKSRKPFDIRYIYGMDRQEKDSKAASEKLEPSVELPERPSRSIEDAWVIKVLLDKRARESSNESDNKSDESTDEDDSRTENTAVGDPKLLEKRSVIFKIWKHWSHGTDESSSDKSKTRDAEEYEYESDSDKDSGLKNTDGLSMVISSEDRKFKYRLKRKRKAVFEYSIDYVINLAGYGKYQKILTCLSGFSGLAGTIHMLGMSVVGNSINCEWKILRWEHAMLTSVVYTGMVIGGPCFGKLATKLGPKTTLRIAMLIMFIFSASSALPPNMSTMLLMRGILGFALGSLNQGIHLCFEYNTSVMRRAALFHISCYCSLGMILLILSYWLSVRFFDSWRLFLFLTSLPTLFVFIVFKWYPESATFLLSGPHPESAFKQLEQLVHLNGKDMPKGRLKPIAHDIKKRNGNLADVCRLKFFRSTVLLWYIWFASGFTYYGLVIMTPLIITRTTMKGVDYTFEINAKNLSLTEDSPITELFITKLPCVTFTDRNFIDMLWITCGEYIGLLIFYILIHYIRYKVVVSISCALSAILTLLLLLNYSDPVIRHVILFADRGNAMGLCQVVFALGSESFPTILKMIVMNTGWEWFLLGGALAPLLIQVLIYNEPTITLFSISLIILFASIAASYLPLNI